MGAAPRRRTPGLSTRRLLVAILFVAILAMAVRQPADTDTWWHLKSGQLIWQQAKLLRADPFSHTVAGQPWIDHGWLVQLGLWPLYHALGLAGLAILLALIVTAAFLLVYLQCAGRPYVAALATLLAAISSSVIWAVRPQIVSFLLAAGLAYLLHRYKASRRARWLWPIPLIVVLWVNSHGGFVIAFILMGCYLLGEGLNHLTRRESGGAPLRPLLLVILVSLPAVLLNPNTWRMIPYAYQTVSIGALQDFIQEWAAPDFHNLQLHPFIWLLLLTLAAMGLSHRRADWTDLALVGLFGYMSLLAVRNVALFALVAPPVLTRHAVAALDDLALTPRLSWLAIFTHTLPPRPPRRPLALANLLLLAVVILAAGAKIALDLARLDDARVWGRGLPVEAAEYLHEADLPGQMFNAYNWGGYLIWTLHPDEPVFVDGRTDLYALNSQVLEDYATVHWLRPGWQEVLDRYDVGYTLTERTGLLDLMLAQQAGWQRAYQDEIAVIYVRSGGGP
ncbi:MAG: hypothetical protein PVJ34_20450 [Anaerolineae bacterium]|jgi:hypothetical protein